MARKNNINLTKPKFLKILLSTLKDIKVLKIRYMYKNNNIFIVLFFNKKL